MKYYRLVFRASDRDANTSFNRPSFRCQLPENLYKDGTNKMIGICLEQFSGYIKKDATTQDDVVVVRMNLGAVNGSQTDGAGRFAACDTLGIATMTHQHTNENFLTCQFSMDKGYLTYPSFMFNQGRIEFNLTHIDDAAITASTDTDFQEYMIVLGVKVLEEGEGY